MRGDTCNWIGTPPGGIAEEDELKSTNDEIERLKKLVDLLLERLEEQNDAEQQQQQQQTQLQLQLQAHGPVASGSGSGGSASLGVDASAAALVDPTAIMTDTPSAVAAASTPYQAHFGACSSQQEIDDAP